MEQEKLLREFASLPAEGRRQVEQLVRLLKKRYARSSSTKKAKRSPLRDEKFVGMWKDREVPQRQQRVGPFPSQE